MLANVKARAKRVMLVWLMLILVNDFPSEASLLILVNDLCFRWNRDAESIDTVLLVTVAQRC